MIEFICILASFVAVVFAIWTIILSSDGNYWSIATAFACIVCVIICALCVKRCTYHIIPNVKTVQIDTVITTCKSVSDTTYVIKYTK